MKRKVVIVLSVSLATVAAMAALLWAFSGVLAAASRASLLPADQSVPPSISYQGRLTDSTGKVVSDGIYTMTFGIYDDSTLGSLLWTQTSSISVTDGLFSVVLGSLANPLGPTEFSGNARWLGTSVNSDPEMSPRQMFHSVPYAIRAETLSAGGIVSGTSVGPTYAFINSGSGPALAVGGDMIIEGDAQLNGDVTWYTRTGRISVSPATFQPFNESYQYNRTGRRLYTDSGEYYYASVNLPDGSTVTSMTFYYRNASAGEIVTMTLKRGAVDTTSTGDLGEVASAYTSANDGYNNDHDDSIDYSQVDNENYIYWLYAHFDGTGDDLRVMAVVVEYQYTEPY